MEIETVQQNNTETAKRDIEINIAPLLSELLSKIWIIALAALIVGLAANGFTRVFVKPTYKCSFTAFVNNQTQTQRDTISSTDISASQQLVQTYSRILTSNKVLMASAEFINLDMSYEQLTKIVSTSVDDKTQIITVNVITTNANTSFKIAQAIANTSPTYMAQIVEGSSMKVVDAPRLPKGRYGPSYFMATLLGILAGGLVTLIIIIIRYFRDDTIKTEGDLEGRFSFPVIGIIPDVNDAKLNGSSYYYSYGYGYGYEAAASKQHHADDEKGKK